MGSPCARPSSTWAPRRRRSCCSSKEIAPKLCKETAAAYDYAEHGGEEAAIRTALKFIRDATNAPKGLQQKLLAESEGRKAGMFHCHCLSNSLNPWHPPSSCFHGSIHGVKLNLWHPPSAVKSHSDIY
ncbi:hypothetical protein EJB05_47165, partial [Eragrostis curvula]